MKPVTGVVDNEKPGNETRSELDQQDIERDANQSCPKAILPARRATGPRTRRGKAKASRNALKYGFFSKHVPIQTPFFREDKEQFKRLLRALAEDWQPVGAAEKIQLELVAIQLYQYLRLLRVQEAFVAKQNTPRIWMDCDDETEGPFLEERKGGVRGPGSKPTRSKLSDDPEIQQRFDQLRDEHARLEELINALPKRLDVEWLLNCCERILRQYYRALSELERLQRMRLGNKVPPRFVVEVQNN